MPFKLLIINAFEVRVWSNFFFWKFYTLPPNLSLLSAT